jgi:serine/threonine protein kinase
VHPDNGSVVAAPTVRVPLTTHLRGLLEEETELSIPCSGPVGSSPLAFTGGDPAVRQVYSALVGQTVHDRFLVLQLLGHGGMAAVYHVLDTRPDLTQSPGRFRSADDQYALKLFAPGMPQPGAGPTVYVPLNKYAGPRAQRFVREFRMGQRRLSTSGRIVSTFHFGATDVALPGNGTGRVAAAGTRRTPVYYFTMQLVRGGSLPRVTQPQPLEKVVALALELLTALDELHGRNIVHRDLTLGNVLLTEPWAEPWDSARATGRAYAKVVLADLGIAKHGALRHDNPLGHVFGTPAFLPPESFSIGNLDPRADLYAAGVILYWLATGRHPLEASGYAPTHALMGFPYALKPVNEVGGNVPPVLAGVIMSLLSREPTARPKTAALAHDIIATWWKGGGHSELAAAKPLRGSPYLCQPGFVGRARELERASAFLSATLEFRPAEVLTRDSLPAQYQDYAATSLPPSVMTICGPPGVGKSRLLSELTQVAADMGVIVLRGQCVSGGGAAMQSLGPVLEQLARLADATVADRGARAGSGVGERYSQRLGRLEHVPTERDEGYAHLTRRPETEEEERAHAELRRRLQMAQAASRLLLACRDQPVVIVQEDCHWADESSSATLAYLMQSVALARSMGYPARVAFVLTHRPAEEGNAVARLHSALEQQAELERPALRFNLEGMTQPEVARLCGALLQAPHDVALDSFASALFPAEYTRPLYVEQVMRTLLDDGLLTEGAYETRPDGTQRWTGSWNLDPEVAKAAPKPANVHEAIGRNVEQLSAGTASVLMYAAAEGREFELDVVSRAAGFEALEALDFLDEATGAGFITDIEPLELAESVSQTKGRRFAFRHDRFREAIYNASPEPMRRRCHGKLLDAIRAVQGDVPEAAESLARHCAGSGQHAEAYKYQVAAAELASRSHAYDHAVELYRQAFVSVSRTTASPPTALRSALVRASISAGFYDVAAEHLSLLLQEPRLSVEERRGAHLQLAELKHRQQDYRNAVGPLKQALQDMGGRIPNSRVMRQIVAAWRMLPVVACGLWPRLVNMRPARDQTLSEVRVRAWYTLGECLYFVDYNDCMFMVASAGQLVVSEGLNAFSPAIFAGIAFGLAGNGLHRIARTYARVARHSMAVAESDVPGLRRPDATVRARINMHIQCQLLLSGDLGEGHLSEHETCAREGVRAAKECGDPQRLWMSLILAACAHLQMGRLRSYDLLLGYLSEQATASRLLYIARVYEARRETMKALLAGSYGKAYDLGESGARVAQAAGGNTEMADLRGAACWARALGAAAGTPADADLVQASLETARTCVELKLFDPGCWPVSQCLAALALCQKHGADAKAIRRVRGASRSTCLKNRVETPLFLGACAAFDVLDGKVKKGARNFAEAVETARRQGAVAQLLDVYRLAAAVYPEGTPEAEMYAWLDHRLTTLVTGTPSPNLEQLLNGEQGPTLQPPGLQDWLADSRALRSGGTRG